MSDVLPPCPEGPVAHRQAFADRMMAHRLEGARGAAGEAGYTRFEIARAILHFAVEEMMLVGRDPDVLDAVLEEANSLAILVEPPRVE